MVTKQFRLVLLSSFDKASHCTERGRIAKKTLESDSTMNKLSPDDINAMECQLRQSMEEDKRYWRVNDVKCDAIHTARTYEEFADRVAAAHLKPLDKSDYKNKKPKNWNPCASQGRNE